MLGRCWSDGLASNHELVQKRHEGWFGYPETKVDNGRLQDGFPLALWVVPTCSDCAVANMMRCGLTFNDFYSLKKYQCR